MKERRIKVDLNGVISKNTPDPETNRLPACDIIKDTFPNHFSLADQ